eukprot:7388574-Prymnesium_polylepis.1
MRVFQAHLVVGAAHLMAAHHAIQMLWRVRQPVAPAVVLRVGAKGIAAAIVLAAGATVARIGAGDLRRARPVDDAPPSHGKERYGICRLPRALHGGVHQRRREPVAEHLTIIASLVRSAPNAARAAFPRRRQILGVVKLVEENTGLAEVAARPACTK